MNQLLLLLVEITAVFTVALVIARLASRARAAVRHLILASAYGVVLILPVATLVSPPVVVEVSVLPTRTADSGVAEPVAATTVDAESPGTASSATATAATAVASIAPAKSISIGTGLFLVWTIGALLAFVPIGTGLWHLHGIRRRSYPWTGGTTRVNELAADARVQAPALLLHDGITAPITGGLLHPMIVLPANAARWSESQVANALAHELEHIQRHDWTVLLAARATCALYWFHPLAWIAWRRLRLEAERACDDAVVTRADAATYAQQLLELARNLVRRPALAGLSMASSSDLSTRIRSVLDNMRPRGRAGKVMKTCIVLVTVLAITALAPLRAMGPPAESAQRAPSAPATAPAPKATAAPAAATTPPHTAGRKTESHAQSADTPTAYSRVFATRGIYILIAADDANIQRVQQYRDRLQLDDDRFRALVAHMEAYLDAEREHGESVVAGTDCVTRYKGIRTLEELARYVEKEQDDFNAWMAQHLQSPEPIIGAAGQARLDELINELAGVYPRADSADILRSLRVSNTTVREYAERICAMQERSRPWRQARPAPAIEPAPAI